jgi:hypothetical protein
MEHNLRVHAEVGPNLGANRFIIDASAVVNIQVAGLKDCAEVRSYLEHLFAHPGVHIEAIHVTRDDQL